MNLDSSMLSALRVFEVAATHGSFTRAAHALELTQSAVSQQMRNLEQRLGYALFVRLARGLALTPKGQQLYHAVSEALRGIQVTVDRLATDAREIQLSCLPSFALQWLMPRLASLHRQHPQVSLRTKATFDVIDARIMAEEGLDIAIRYDDGDYPQLPCRVLMQEYLVPVATPQYLARHRGLAQGDFDTDVVLLHDSSPWAGAAAFVEWSSWAAMHQPALLDRIAGPEFNLASLAIAAAVNHQGVAMGRMALVQDELERGVLVDFSGKRLLSPARYVAVTGPAGSPHATEFLDWLQAECDAYCAWRDRRYGPACGA